MLFMTNIYTEIKARKQRIIQHGIELLFTPWQVSILEKLANSAPLSSAERQELSRRIKPKLLAIDSLSDLKLLHPFFN